MIVTYFRDEMDLVFCLAAWLSSRHAKLTVGTERRVRILGIECVSFFPFFPSYRFSIFSRSNAHTHTNKEGAKRCGKAERETDSSSLHSISGLQVNV